MGGGSAQLNPHYRITPLDGMIQRIGQDRIEFAKDAQITAGNL